MGVRVTLVHWVAGYMRFSRSRSASSSGSAASASELDASSNTATIGLIVGIVGHLLVTRDPASNRIARGSHCGTGRREGRIDGHTFGQHHVDAAPRVHLDDR